MVREALKPTPGKMAVMIVFLLGSFLPSSISNFPNLTFDVISQLQLILLLPWIILNMASLSYLGIALWLVYIYVIVCIYVTAFHFIEPYVKRNITDPAIKGRKSKTVRKRRKR